MYTIGEGPDRLVSRKTLEHNHAADLKKLQRQIVSTTCKRKAEEELTSTPSKICRMAIRNLTIDSHDHLNTNDLNCIKKKTYTTQLICRHTVL